ncbi:MAG: hypothetical protein LW878_07510 [Proteobacteria bacterium]|jgi:hypothetical protein|nr:hypothetical protein [Pseudomonadota bacterium]
MNLNIYFALMLLSISLSSWSAPIKLAYGGSVNLDVKEWEVVDTKQVIENIPQSFVHRKYSDLKGWLLGGTPDSVAKCSKLSKSSFGVCSETSEKDNVIYYQVILTRQVDTKAFQNYLISFSFSKSEEKKYRPIVEAFISQIGKTNL